LISEFPQIVAITVFSFSLYDLLSKKRKISVSVIQTLHVYLGEMLALTSGSVILSLFTMWAVSTARKKQKLTAAVVSGKGQRSGSGVRHIYRILV
jgi:hypothetical protein